MQLEIYAFSINACRPEVNILEPDNSYVFQKLGRHPFKYIIWNNADGMPIGHMVHTQVLFGSK